MIYITLIKEWFALLLLSITLPRNVIITFMGRKWRRELYCWSLMILLDTIVAIFFPSTQNRMFLFHVEFSVGLAIKKLRPSRWTNNRQLSNILCVLSPHPGRSNDNWQPISSWTRFYLKNTLSNLSAGVSKCSLQMIGLS